MGKGILPRDESNVPAAGAVAYDDPDRVYPQQIDPATGRLLVTATGTVFIADDTYTAVTGDATATGDNPIVSVAPTDTLRLYYICLSANGANGADVTATVKLGAAELFKISLKAGAIWARNIGAGRHYLEGADAADLIVELSDTQTVHVSAEYEII